MTKEKMTEYHIMITTVRGLTINPQIPSDYEYESNIVQIILDYTPRQVRNGAFCFICLMTDDEFTLFWLATCEERKNEVLTIFGPSDDHDFDFTYYGTRLKEIK